MFHQFKTVKYVLFFLIGTNLEIVCSKEAFSSNVASCSSSLNSSENTDTSSFVEKRKKLYRKLNFFPDHLAIIWKCNITVNRSENVAIQSFKQILTKKKFGLSFKWTLNVKYTHENGQDFGGLSKEWFTLVSSQMTRNELGLFQYSDKINIRQDPDHIWKNIEYFEAAGIFTGMAIHHRHFLNVSFSNPFLRSILNKPIDLEDIKIADKVLYNSLMKIKKMTDVSQMDLKYYKKLENKKNDEGNEIEVAVTNENKEEYIRYIISETYADGIKEPMSKFLKGFRSVISLNLIKDFNEDELDLLISGVQSIDLQDWKKHTTYRNCREKIQILWFWEIMEKFDNKLRSKLLEFVTGSSRVPPDGFSGFINRYDRQAAFTIQIIVEQKNSYPEANTCSRSLILREYTTKDELENKLRFVLEQPFEFARS